MVRFGTVRTVKQDSRTLARRSTTTIDTCSTIVCTFITCSSCSGVSSLPMKNPINMPTAMAYGEHSSVWTIALLPTRTTVNTAFFMFYEALHTPALCPYPTQLHSSSTKLNLLPLRSCDRCAASPFKTCFELGMKPRDDNEILLIAFNAL